MKGSTIGIIIGVVVLVIAGIVAAVILSKKSGETDKLGVLDQEEIDAAAEAGLSSEEIASLDDADPSEVKAQVKATIKGARKLCRALCKAKYPHGFLGISAKRAKCRKSCKADAIKKGFEYVKANY